jgi:hypothetical protein
MGSSRLISFTTAHLLSIRFPFMLQEWDLHGRGGQGCRKQRHGSFRVGEPLEPWRAGSPSSAKRRPPCRSAPAFSDPAARPPAQGPREGFAVTAGKVPKQSVPHLPRYSAPSHQSRCWQWRFTRARPYAEVPPHAHLACHERMQLTQQRTGCPLCNTSSPPSFACRTFPIHVDLYPPFEHYFRIHVLWLVGWSCKDLDLTKCCPQLSPLAAPVDKAVLVCLHLLLECSVS